MNYMVSVGAIFLVFILTAQSHSVYAYSDPKHCRVYDACYAIGYNDGYNDAKNGISPSYPCLGHGTCWCERYNDGFRAGNGVVIFSKDKGVTKVPT